MDDWFKVKPKNALIGKAPLDTLKAAVDEVLAQYQKAHGRRPTTAEWEALMTVTLDRFEVGVMKSVTIDLAGDDEPDGEPRPPKKSSPLH